MIAKPKWALAFACAALLLGSGVHVSGLSASRDASVDCGLGKAPRHPHTMNEGLGKTVGGVRGNADVMLFYNFKFLNGTRIPPR